MPGPLTSSEQELSLDIAIVGGGIIGLILANGLCRQENVRVKVYEQAQSFREIGAGMAFTANATQCMELIDPAILSAFQLSGAVAISGSGSENVNAGLQWVDGYNQHEGWEGGQKWLYKVDAGHKGFQGCRRDQFLEALVAISPPGMVECKKRIDRLAERGTNDKIELTFGDGTSATADAVIGCDGLKSRVRESILGKDNPAAYVRYTHIVAYRGLIPMDKAIGALGEYQARNQHFYVGPNSHIITYPVANQTVMNVSLFVPDPNKWTGDQSMVAKGTRRVMEDAFADWSPRVRALTHLLPEELQRWALFDLWDYPAPFYNKGKVCIAGDAAHASSPHHGAGACMGVEDALCLSTLMKQVSATIQKNGAAKGEALKVAFETYNAIRRRRTQWLVDSSRRVCDLYQQPEWGDPTKWVRAETCFEEIKDRSYKIWHFDYNTMIKETIEGFQRRESAAKATSDGALERALNGILSGNSFVVPNRALDVVLGGAADQETSDTPARNDVAEKVSNIVLGEVQGGVSSDALAAGATS